MKSKIDDDLVKCLKCVRKHVEKSLVLHLNEGSIFRVEQELKCIKEDLTQLTKRIRYLKRLPRYYEIKKEP